MSREQFAEGGLGMEHADHLGLSDAHDLAFDHRPGCRQPLRLATARAMVESEIMRVGKAEMIRVLHAEPAFGELFTAHLLTRNSRVEADLVDQLFNSSEKRLARTLLMLARYGQENPQRKLPKISQET